MEALGRKSMEVLAEESNVVEVDGPRYLVGDVHGQFYDFLKMMREVGRCVIIECLQAASVSSSETMWTGAITRWRLSATC